MRGSFNSVPILVLCKSQEKVAAVPLNKVVKDLIMDKWVRTEEGGTPKGNLPCLYPFSLADSATWDSTLKVDTAVVHLSVDNQPPQEVSGH